MAVNFNILTELPAELTSAIFNMLDNGSLSSVQLTSKAWRTLSDAKEVEFDRWAQYLYKSYPRRNYPGNDHLQNRLGNVLNAKFIDRKESEFYQLIRYIPHDTIEKCSKANHPLKKYLSNLLNSFQQTTGSAKRCPITP